MPANARTTPDGVVLVSPDNFVRAESDLSFGNVVKDGGVGKFFHIRELTPVDHQIVIRQNRDTMYSAAVFDLEAGPVTVTLPDAGERFLSMQVIDQDEYTHDVFYDEGPHTITRERIGTRYIAAPVRILVNPNDPSDVAAVHALQDAVVVKQHTAGAFEVPKWDPKSQKTVRDALVTLANTLPDSGYFSPNPQNAYSFNNLTAHKGPDGNTTIQFGGCDGNVPNCLPITPSWNYTVRLYRPQQPILDGSWTFPEARPV